MFHLFRYIDEQALRYNHRNHRNGFNDGKRVRYGCAADCRQAPNMEAANGRGSPSVKGRGGDDEGSKCRYCILSALPGIMSSL